MKLGKKFIITGLLALSLVFAFTAFISTSKAVKAEPDYEFELTENGLYIYGDDDGYSSTLYDGQDEAGDGKISSIYAYMTDRHPTWTYKNQYTISSSYYSTAYETQMSTSYYVKFKCDSSGTATSTTYSSEGNCVLNTVLNVLYNWSKKSKVSGLSFDATTVTYANDVWYSTYGQKTVVYKLGYGYHYWQTRGGKTSASYPKVYTELRSAAISNYGYSVYNGVSNSNVAPLYKYVCNTLHGNSISVTKSSSNTQALTNVRSGVASHMILQNSSTYDDHSVVLIGYRTYTYTSGSTTYTKYMYKIIDNHGSICWFDPNVTTFGSQIFVYLG